MDGWPLASAFNAIEVVKGERRRGKCPAVISQTPLVSTSPIFPHTRTAYGCRLQTLTHLSCRAFRYNVRQEAAEGTQEPNPLVVRKASLVTLTARDVSHPSAVMHRKSTLLLWSPLLFFAEVMSHFSASKTKISHRSQHAGALFFRQARLRVHSRLGIRLASAGRSRQRDNNDIVIIRAFIEVRDIVIHHHCPMFTPSLRIAVHAWDVCLLETDSS